MAQPLEIVNDELAVTLGEARAALEQFADGEGTAHLERCAALLHTARGVLQLTQTYGASLLAEEMEQTCRFLASLRREDAAAHEEGIDALMRAAVQLPAYVDRILGGGRDLPLVLLPLLNDLRATRGRPLLSESTLLLLNSEGPSVPPKISHQASGEDIQQLARELRPRYQLALLALIRGESQQAAVARMAEVAARLEAAATEAPVYQLWWVVSGVLEGLGEGGLEPGVSLKRLLGQTDRELRRLHAQGEAQFARQPPADLLNNLLYYVARAQSAGERVSAIRDAFNLAGLIPGDAQVEAARQSLAAPSVRLMQTVAAAIREDLARVKDVLDIYLRTGMKRSEELFPQVELLKKIGDTLGVLGLGGLRETVQSRRRDLELMVAGEQPPDETALVGLAADLLDVEDQLERALIDLVRPDPAEDPARADADAADDSEFAPVARAVLRECLVNLVRVKETITEVAEHGGDSVTLDQVPGLLRGLVSALMMLGRERAARLAESIIRHTREVVRRSYPDEGRSDLERLADAIVSLEFYLETLQAGRREPSWMLDNADRSLDAIGRPQAQPALAGAEVSLAAVEDELPATVVAGARTRLVPDAERPVIAAAGPRIDPEILELFIEEAREAIDTINAQFPVWLQDEQAEEALKTIRRSFHTLKGSGRIVGAELFGEYCWSVEKLLNRIIDGSLARTAGLIALLQRAIIALPELLEQLEVGSEPVTDIGALMREAEAWSTNPQPVPEPPVESETAPVPAHGMDPVLLDILTREMAEHLAVLRDFAHGASGQPVPPRVSEAVHRAAHTLHGSLTMARVEVATPVSRLLQDAVTATYAAGQPATPPLLAGCRAAVDYFAGLMAHLQDTEVPAPDCGPVLEQLAALAGVSASPQAPEATRAEPEPGDPGVGDPAGAGSPGMAATVFDLELAAIFAEEAAELLESSEHALTRLRDGDEPADALAELQRQLHTLKGGARMAALFPMADLSHELESLLLRTDAPRLSRDASLQALVQTSLDHLHQLRDQLAGGAAMELPLDLMKQLNSAARGAAPSMPADEPARVEPDLAVDTPAEDASAQSADLRAAAGKVPPEPEVQPSQLVASEAEAPWPTLEPEPDLPETATEAGPEVSPEPEVGAEPAALDAPEPELDLESGPAAVPAPGTEEQPEEPAQSLAAAPAASGPEALLDAGTDAILSALPGESEAPLAGEPPPAERGSDAAVPDSDGDTGKPAEAEPAPEAPASTLPALDRLVALARELRAPPVRPADTPRPEQRPAEPRELARVDAGLLEQLLNGAGEISIANARLSQQLNSVQFHLEELGQTVVRLRNQLRKLEIETEAQILWRHQNEPDGRGDFDPLEMDRYSGIQQLSRGLAETASDVSSLRDLLDQLTADAESLLVQQARTANDLQDGLMRTRMVPFEQHSSRLARLVRQAARDAGKQAELHIEGSGELDRHVLEQMLPAFEHMLRNAVVHGIEFPPERTALGKPDTGRILISLYREGSEVVIIVSDDGRGLDVDGIRRKALELGLITPEMTVTDEEAMQFILRPGFSTAERLTQAAGRGVGMDVVASQIARLGGTLSLAAERGLGSRFTVRLPFTLAVTQALIVRVGSELYALPLPTVEGVIRLVRVEFDQRMRQAEPMVEYGGQRYQLRHLGQYLGMPAARPADDQERVSVILVRAGENSTALVTDEMLDSREVVVKSVGPQLATIRGITGATILGDGRIAVILDAGALVRSVRPLTREDGHAAPTAAVGPLALVVDDSITMRRVTQRFLERNGFRVLTAKDGVEAISVLQDHLPDIVLLDVEMPRMDGYEFARHVRNNPGTENLPIIMITSRVSDKHRARAIECGVNDYIGKPYQEQQLLEAVHNQLEYL